MFPAPTYRGELPELDAGGAEDLGGVAVHAVALAIDDLGDADLDDLDAAGEAGAGVAVEDAAGADALAAGLEQGVLLGVEAEAGGEGGAGGLPALGRGVVAAGAAAVAAVAERARRAVVPGGHDAVQDPVHQHTPHRPLHAVASPRRQRRQRHEVAVPPRPQPLRVRQLQLPQRRVQVRQVRGRVQQPHRRPRDQREQTARRRVQLRVGARYEVLQTATATAAFAAVVVAIVSAVVAALLLLLLLLELPPLPPHRHRRVDADQQEEGPAGQQVQDRLVVHVRRHEPRAPVPRDEVQQCLRRREHVRRRRRVPPVRRGRVRERSRGLLPLC